jgi:hypothetical protein
MVHQQSIGPFSGYENDCPLSGPFSELENDCPSEILDHFPDWKVTAQPGPFSKLENDCPYINNISVLPPNLGSNHFPFQ